MVVLVIVIVIARWRLTGVEILSDAYPTLSLATMRMIRYCTQLSSMFEYLMYILTVATVAFGYGSVGLKSHTQQKYRANLSSK